MHFCQAEVIIIIIVLFSEPTSALITSTLKGSTFSEGLNSLHCRVTCEKCLFWAQPLILFRILHLIQTFSATKAILAGQFRLHIKISASGGMNVL